MPRARPLPPDERRAAIIDAARPLLLEHGALFTTKQVAEAAGIAEGTIFRVFESKDDLVGALFDAAIDPTPLCRRLAAIDTSRGIDAVVQQVISLLVEGVQDISAVFTAVHRGAGSLPPRTAVHPKPTHHQLAEHRAEQLLAAVMDALRPFEAQLALPLDQAASLIRSVALATSHPFFSDRRVTDAATVSQTLLHGLIRTPSVTEPKAS